MSDDHPRTPLTMVVLALLVEQPMHAYRIRALIESRDKASVVNVARSNSVYQVLERLQRDELIRVRPGNQPAKTTEPRRSDRPRGAGPSRIVYEPTRQGRATLRRWMATMLSAPAREFPEFPAVLAMVAILTPAVLLRQLEARIVALEEIRDAARGRAKQAERLDLPRVLLLEDEYKAAIVKAELDWVRGIVRDLRSGTLDWSRRELAARSARYESTA